MITMHDDGCESESIIEAAAWSPCRCAERNADPGNLPERVWELEQRIEKLEARLQGVIETHHLWDGS